MTTSQRVGLGLLALSAAAIVVVCLDIRAEHTTALHASPAAARRAGWVFWGGPLAVVGSTLWLAKHSISYQVDSLTLWGTGALHALGWGLLLVVSFILSHA